MNYRIITSLILAATLGLSSCNKFLEEKTQDQLVPKSTRDYSELLFGDGYPRTLDPMVVSVFLMDDDIANVTDRFFGNDITYLNDSRSVLDVYSWQPDFFEILNASTTTPGLRDYNSWYTYFSKISACNIALDNADKSTGTQSEIDYLKGEAYTLRAYYYFMLVNLYGLPYNAPGSDRTKNPGVPLVLSSEFRNEYYVRASVDEVYKQVVSDLEAGITLLDKEKKISTIYRINYKAAHLLASRVYLYMEEWNKSVQHATAVLDVQNSLLQLNGWGTPNATSKAILSTTNVEAIWAFSTTNFLNSVRAGSNGVAKYMISQDLLDQYSSDDLRKAIYAIPKVNGSYPADLGKWPSVLSTTAQPFPQLFRVSEAYLNRAEANIQQFKKGDAAAGQSAINDLNTLRKFRINAATYTDWTVTTPDQLLADCRNERRREFFWENHRWFDLRRYGMPAIEHVFNTSMTTKVKYRLEEKDPQYVLPIPGIVLLQNNLLTQNPLGPRKQALPL